MTSSVRMPRSRGLLRFQPSAKKGLQHIVQAFRRGMKGRAFEAVMHHLEAASLQLEDHPIVLLGAKLIDKNKETWDPKTQRQAAQMYAFRHVCGTQIYSIRLQRRIAS